MERLTIRNGDGAWDVPLRDDDGVYIPSQEIIDRLAAYEDTGLEPEEVESCKAALAGREIAKITKFDGISIEALKEIAKAYQEGRLLVLPCKVGDTAWRIFNGEITRLTIVSVSFNDHIKPRVRVECLPFCRFYWNDVFGKTVFLAREAAEAAMEALQKA